MQHHEDIRHHHMSCVNSSHVMTRRKETAKQALVARGQGGE